MAMDPFLYTEKFQQRFWSYVNKDAPNGCWEWTGSTRHGYGRIYLNKKVHLVHRLSYMMVKGEIADGLVLDHLCRNRKCVNPEHLEAVTERVNVLRGIGVTARNALKTHCPRGHSYDDVNTRHYQGERICRQCATLLAAEKRQRIQAERQARVQARRSA